MVAFWTGTGWEHLSPEEAMVMGKEDVGVIAANVMHLKTKTY